MVDAHAAGVTQGGAQHLQEGAEAVRVFGDEGVVKHRGAGGGAGGIIRRDQRLADTADRGDVAPRLDLVILRGDLRRRAAQHLGRRLRIGEAFEAALAQRVEGDDRRAAAAGVP